ncbi:MAG TPA: redoxin domain-containing protein [Chthonomonadaceae bacterium]|nr:redoxin domain-containing protein [Chthonomonadaceae bacterium]
MLARLFNGALLMAAAGLAASLSVGAKAGELKLGDSAPTLKVSKFVKGDPVTKFQHGKIYVVEFWATWCGPCRTSIPHLTEMAKKYKSVQFVGVSVWENKQADVAPFVKEMGDKMGYTVAMDDVPAGKTGNEGYMAENWMSAAHQDGIPTAFVIDKDTKVAWIGHPMGIDEPLGKIVAGSWDIKAESAKFAKEQANQKKLMALNEKIGKSLQSKDFTAALATVNDAIAEDPSLEEAAGLFKWAMLKQLDRTADANTYLGRLVDTVFKDNAMQLNQVAWSIVDPDSPKKPAEAEAKVALRAAIRADELTKSKDAAIGDTLAAAYHAAGDNAKAIATQEHVLALAKGTELEKDASLKAHLDLYKKSK